MEDVWISLCKSWISTCFAQVFKTPIVIFPLPSPFRLIMAVSYFRMVFLLPACFSWNIHPNVFSYIDGLKWGNFCFANQLKCISAPCLMLLNNRSQNVQSRIVEFLIHISLMNRIIPFASFCDMLIHSEVNSVLMRFYRKKSPYTPTLAFTYDFTWVGD